MKKIFTFAALVVASGLHAQITDPVATEVWHPVPRVVTYQGTSTVPSDAIVLFGGNNLEQWVSDKDGGKAMWEVKDGIFTVKAGTGDIKTKQKFGSCQLHLEFRTPCGGGWHRPGQGQQRCFLPGKIRGSNSR